MPLLLTFIAILTLILLIAWLKIDTFISFLLVSIALGLASGLDVDTVSKAIQKGVGGTLGDLVLIVGFGAMLGEDGGRQWGGTTHYRCADRPFSVKNISSGVWPLPGL
jgi:hypothetical protein